MIIYLVLNVKVNVGPVNMIKMIVLHVLMELIE